MVDDDTVAIFDMSVLLLEALREQEVMEHGFSPPL